MAWPEVRLGDVCNTGAGGTPLKSRSEFYEGGNIPWILSGEISQGEIKKAQNFITSEGLQNSSAKLFPPNTVLVAMYGATAGQVGILKLEACTNQAVCGIFPNEKTVPKFLYYIFLYKKKELVASAAGNAQPNISQIKVKNTKIPLPPVSEQKRIVAILDEAFEGIDAAIANTEANLANTQNLFERIVTTRIFSVSDAKKWKQTTVKSIAASHKESIRTGPFGSQLLHREFVDEGIAVLGIDNAVRNSFTWGKRRFITPEKYKQLSRYKVFPGDVLITIMGTCGRCAIVPDDIPEAINTKHLCCITLDKARCLPIFLHYYFLYHPVAREYLLKQAKGAIMDGLNMGIIKELPLLLPPVEEQRLISDQIDCLSEETESLGGLQTQKLDLLSELKQSILQKAFSGELTRQEAA